MCNCVDLHEDLTTPGELSLTLIFTNMEDYVGEEFTITVFIDD